MIKFLLLVLAFNLIGIILERVKKNALKKKEQMDSAQEEELSPPVVNTPDVFGELFGKLSFPEKEKYDSNEHEDNDIEHEENEIPVFQSEPAYAEHHKQEAVKAEVDKREDAKIRDGRGLIELIEAQQKAFSTEQNPEAAPLAIEENVPLPYETTVRKSMHISRANLRKAILYKEILEPPRALRPYLA